MHREVAWSLSMPARPVTGVVPCLHGKGADHRFAFDKIHLPDVVELLKAPLEIAAVDGGRDSNWHPTTDGTNGLAMVDEEFVPIVQAGTGCQRAAVLGWSVGAYPPSPWTAPPISTVSTCSPKSAAGAHHGTGGLRSGKLGKQQVPGHDRPSWGPSWARHRKEDAGGMAAVVAQAPGSSQRGTGGQRDPRRDLPHTACRGTEQPVKRRQPRRD